MKLRATHWLLLLALVSILAGVSGCATNDPDNASVRPWNTPAGGGGALGGINYQHQ
jgi:hypothetical protein